MATIFSNSISSRLAAFNFQCSGLQITFSLHNPSPILPLTAHLVRACFFFVGCRVGSKISPEKFQLSLFFNSPPSTQLLFTLEIYLNSNFFLHELNYFIEPTRSEKNSFCKNLLTFVNKKSLYKQAKHFSHTERVDKGLKIFQHPVLIAICVDVRRKKIKSEKTSS